MIVGLILAGAAADSGEFTGSYTTAATTYGFIATPLAATATITPSAAAAAPEPSTWALMLAGFAGLGLAGYRKARNRRTAVCA